MSFKIHAAALIAVLTSLCMAAQEPSPSRDWVRSYVSNTVQTAVSRMSGATVYSAGTGQNAVRIVIEDATVYALRATNATAAAVSCGVTNGMYFIWNESIHGYTNVSMTIVSTQTNFVWMGVSSSGQSFDGWFDVVGRMLQPSVAEEVAR